MTGPTITPKASRSPKRGAIPIKAVLFDTYGTVCDFYRPMRRVLGEFAAHKGIDCNSGDMAIDWRTAYLISTATQAFEEQPFVPLNTINRTNLKQVINNHLGLDATDDELTALNSIWNALDPWPDTVEGLTRIKAHAVIAPLSNGNFADMVWLSRYARLPWDIILGASLSGYYKPHPDTYLKSVAALNLAPEQVCMVAAHQADLAYAAGHGMQTAFVTRPEEFGGAVKPAQPEPGVSYHAAAEVHPESDWTYIATDFFDLASQLEADLS